jgi:hypothetical protein
MPLADDIATHRDRTLSVLNAAHDYYVSTKTVWRIVQQHIDAGETVSVTNATTGTVITHVELAAKAQSYVTEYLAVATLQQFVSVFEDFLIGLMRCWLLVHPDAFGKKQIPISLLLEATDLDQAKRSAIDQELNALSYKKLKEWFVHLDSLMRLGCPSEDEIGTLAEIKATRDVFIHNRGIANATYEVKAGAKARFQAGEQLDVPEPYHRKSWELIKKVVTDMSAAAIAKA